MERHNIKISLFKFLFAVLVVLFHGTIMFLDLDKIHIFKGGYIGVEFFFIVSGFLLAKSVSKKWNDDLNIGKDLFNFIKKKVLVFLPYVLLAHFIIFILKIILGDASLSDFILSFYDVFFIWMAGFNGTHFNPSIWYLSAMLIAMMMIYPLFRKYKNNYVSVLPIILILGFGLLNKNYISLDISWNKWNGLFHWGLFRAFLEINLGILIYFLVEKIKNIKITKLGKICLTGIELIGFVVPFIIGIFVDKNVYDYILLIMISISIGLSFSNLTYQYIVLKDNLVLILEKLSFSLFVNHWIVYIIFEYFISKVIISYALGLSLYLLMVIILAMIIMFIVEFLKKRNFYLNHLFSLFIEV